MDSGNDRALFARLLHKKDDALLDEIAERVRLEGDNVLQLFFQELAACTFTPKEARKHWHGFLAHREQLCQTVGRKLNIMATLCDYLEHVTGTSVLPVLDTGRSLPTLFHDTVYDKLTGLNNRTYFDEVFEQQVSSATRYRTDLTILFLDIDNFKDVNDRFGHQAGDEALRMTAAVIGEMKRDSDIAIRFGGEEFVLLMPHTGKINGLVLGERIRIGLAEKTVTYGSHIFSITLSGGLASYPLDGETTGDLLATADRALYQAKGAGKNVISLYREDKRRYLRVRFNQPVFVKELGLDENATYAGQAKDICIGGILFKNAEPLTVGTKIQIHTQVSQGKPLLLIGTVVRVESFGPSDYDIGVALSFTELEKVAKKEISGLLHADN